MNFCIFFFKKSRGKFEESKLQKVNLTSIMSRPTRSQIGNYHFFIDVDGHQEEAHIAAALQQIQKQYTVTVIGSYIKAN